jgi:hypothetical protein
MWRILSGLIFLFWAMMTWLLVQRSYFGEKAQRVAIPVNDVLASFAAHQSGLNTLQLVHGQAKRGQATFNLQDRQTLDGKIQRGYALNAGGMIESATASQGGGNISWRFEGDIDPALLWQRLELRLRVAATDTSIIFSWHHGDEQPVLEVLRDGQRIMDMKSALAQGAMAQSLTGMGGFSMLPGMNKEAALESLIQLTAYQDRLTIAGSQRQSRVLKLAIMGFYEATAHFTDTGELARIDLPDGFKFIDPMILGLEQPTPAK